MARDDLGRWVPGTSGNAGGRPKPPDGLRTRLAELSPRAVERLGELLDSDDERVRLEAAKAILDRHLGRPAIQADISLHRRCCRRSPCGADRNRSPSRVGADHAGGCGGADTAAEVFDIIHRLGVRPPMCAA